MTGLRARPTAEVALLAVHLAVVAGFARLYRTDEFAPDLLTVVVVAWVAAVALRRSRAPGTLSIAAMVLGLPFVVSWTVFGDTTSAGLPTGRTWDALGEAMAVAREAYPVVIAPTDVLPGFQAISAIALWVSVWFADWTAFRVRSTAEALIPAFGVFTFCALLGSGRHEVATAVAFAAAALVFVASHRVARGAHPRATPTLAPRHAAAAAGIAAVAVLAGAALGPSVPGARSQALVDWRNTDRDPSRLTVSPMVELNRRLVEQRDTLAFTVEADQPSYWRLTALDRFDGEIWSSSGEFDDADGSLDQDSGVPDGGTLLEQRFRIANLEAIWAPAAFQPVGVDDDGLGLRWDATSSTLIVAGDRETSNGTTYVVRSQLPDLDPDLLRQADGPPRDEIAERFLPLPDDLPELATSIAEQVAGGEPTAYDRAIALQDFFRTQFQYSLEVPAGHDGDALEAFLRSGEGYCEQFAGAYAAMARHLGLPSRVAVGFTPGQEDPGRPGTYQVTGRYAHAWPEVWFEGVGWVPFEPTPSRGLPGAEAYTGVEPSQDDGRGGVETPPTTVTTAPAPTSPEDPADPPTPTTAPQPDDVEAGPAPTSTDEPSDGSPLVPIAAAVVLAAVVVGVLLLRRRGPRPTGPEHAAWLAATERIGRATGRRPRPEETPVEFARRAAPAVPTAAAPLLALARIATEAQWSPSAPVAERAARAEAQRDAVVAAVPIPRRTTRVGPGERRRQEPSGG